MAGTIGVSVVKRTISTGNTQTINIINSAGAQSVTVRITEPTSGVTLYSGGTLSGTMTVEVPKTWFDRAGRNTVTSMDVRVTVTATFRSGSGSTSTQTAMCLFTVNAGADMRPTISNQTATPVNTGNAAVYYPSTYIAGKTRMKVTAKVTRTTAAQISQVKLNIAGGETVTMSYNSSSDLWEGTTSALRQNAQWTVTAVDQRGLQTVTQAQSVTVVAYTDPVVNIDAAGTYRCDPAGDEADDGSCYKAKANAVYTTGLTGNSLLQFDVRLQGQATGTALTSGVQSATISAGMNPGLAYTLVFTIQDKVIDAPATFTFELLAPNRDFVIHHSAGGTNVGVGCIPSVTSGESTVELPAGGKFMIGGVSLVDIFYPVGCIYMSDINTNPGTLFGGTWQPLSSISSHYAWKRTA